MKQNLMLFAIFLLASPLLINSDSFAQNSSPYWSLEGNSNASSSSKLGTTNSTPVKFFTANSERMQINADGRVAIGTSNAFIGKFTVFNNGSTPSGAWNRPAPPVFMGFGENASGNADLLLGMSSNNSFARPVFFGRRARGTLSSPSAVQTNDYLSSFLVSGYDGSSFQNPASIDFYADGTPTSGHVPTRLSLVTGTNSSDRQERLKVLYNGDFDFNDGQMFLDQSNKYVGIGVSTPSVKLHVETTGTAIYGNSTGGGYGVVGYGGNTGVFGYGTTYGVSASYGVYGGTGSATSYAGYFAGKVYFSSGYVTSDQNLKKNIQDMDNAMDIINKLKPKHYDFREDGDYAKMNLPKGHHYGLIAQEVETVLPNLISETEFDVNAATPLELKEGEEAADNGTGNSPGAAPRKIINFKALNYTELIPIVVKGMQEQQEEISQLKAELAELKSLVQNLAQASGGKLLYAKGFLGQNVPNPANGNTTIAYSVPDDGTNGEIRVTDSKGRFIKTYRVNGNGQLTIPKTLLAAGVYNYSLYNNGQLVQTKQMIISR
ncbi:hypothetical protein BH20BAC1_BH20BAC1_06640 [soil metagenome]